MADVLLLSGVGAVFVRGLGPGLLLDGVALLGGAVPAPAHHVCHASAPRRRAESRDEIATIDRDAHIAADARMYRCIRMPMWWVYMLQIAWYIHCTYAHVFLDKYKKDFWAMFIHHVVTLALVYFAYVGGYASYPCSRRCCTVLYTCVVWLLTLASRAASLSASLHSYYRVGLLVFWSFDICDVFLHLSKAHRYIVNVRSLPDPYKLFLFAMVPVTWLLFRIIFFPWKVLTTAFAYSIMYGGWANVSAWGLFNSLLGILTLLQVRRAARATNALACTRARDIDMRC